MSYVSENSTHTENRLQLLAAILLAVPFYLNDFANIYVGDWRWWLLIDYLGVKLLPFLVVLWLISTRRMAAREFGLTTQPVPSCLLVFLIASVVGTVIDQNGYQVLASLPGYPRLGGMPSITSSVWNWLDLTLGLLMVGIFEELVFRGFAHTFIGRYTGNAFAIVAISSVAFGLAHWSGGLHSVVITSTIGSVFMMAYLRTRSLPAIMLAHFAIDFIAFADVIPRSVFRFI